MSPLWMYYIKYFSLRQMLFFPFTEKKRNILLVYWFRAKERDSRIANFFSRITWKFLPKPFGLPAVKQWLKVLLQNVKDDVDFWKFLNGIYFKDEGGRHFEAQGLFFFFVKILSDTLQNIFGKKQYAWVLMICTVSHILQTGIDYIFFRTFIPFV